MGQRRRVTVYLIHFSIPVAHARHYIGYTPDDDTKRRIAEHTAGTGSPLVAAALRNGSSLAIWKWRGAGRDFERWLKDQHSTPRLCPFCTGNTPPGPERITARFRATKRSYDV